jgi:hypothetical protein
MMDILYIYLQKTDSGISVEEIKYVTKRITTRYNLI